MTRFSLQFLIAVALPLLIGLLFSETVEKEIINADETRSVHSQLLPDIIPGKFSGGFKEQTCHSCHFDYDINDPRGSLAFTGLKEGYEPGREYKITLHLESERLEKGGFQLTSRFGDGLQAGKLSPLDDHTMFTPESVTGDSVQYLQHTTVGTGATGENKIEWTFGWTAPASDDSPVLFNISANAANDDFSPFGDWIYVQEIKVEPAE